MQNRKIMGNSKNASFSYSDKPNVQLLKDKFKETSVDEKFKNDKNGRTSENGKKKKKNFWSKWLSSVRESWSCGEAQKTEVAKKRLEKRLRKKDQIIDSERTDFQKIIVEPTRMELKPVVTEYQSPLTYSDEMPVLRKDSCENEEDKNSEIEINEIKEEPLLNQTQSLAKNSDIFEDKKEPPQKIESLFASALFIHKDLNRMVESAVFLEPTLPRDYAESGTSGEISQKSLKINNAHTSYQEKGRDQVIKTCKTTSEPTWEEKKKLINRERLKENIHYLVKQYVFLEAQDVVDFSRPKSISEERKKRVPFNYRRSDSTAYRNLTRAVSPEVLVNIKPFKEYVSENISHCPRLEKSSTLRERQERPAKKYPIRTSENVEIEKVSKKHNSPVIKSVSVLKKNDSVPNEKNCFGIEESILTLSPIKSNLNKNTSENIDIESRTFSFWDLYKTYSRCKNLLQVEVEIGNTSFQLKSKEKENKIKIDVEDEEEGLQSSKSLDEVLDSLEDEDHDLIFKKNMPQFKKKISVMPRLDFRKFAYNTNKKGLTKTEDRTWQKLVKLENPLEIKNPIAQKVSIDSLLINSRGEKIEMCRSEFLDLRTESIWKSGKILENVYLASCEKAVINQVLASRVETKTLSFSHTLREVHDMQENNNVAVIKIENPISFDKALRNITKKTKTIALFLYFNRCGSYKNSTSNKIKLDKCASENFLSPLKRDESSLEFLKITNSCQLNLGAINCEVTLCREHLELSDGEGNKNIEKLTEICLNEKTKTGEEMSRRVVLILNHPSYEYTVCIFDKRFGSPKVYSVFHSEPDLHKNLFNEERHQSDPALKKEMATSGTMGIANERMRSENYSNGSFDCFNALHSSSNDNEDKTISRQTLSKRQSSHFNARFKKTNTKTEVKIQKSKEILQERDFSEKLLQRLRHKSIPTPKEIIMQNQLFQEKNRARRTKIYIKKQFADLFHCGEKKVSAEETIEMKRTTKEVALILKPEGEIDKRKMFLVKKSGMNVKKEVMAAINLIKDLKSCKEETKKENKRLSFLILLSKN